ncbi:hypothetical protein [Planococcus sp. YIM B11945]|uniref:hypothetical protein n=1 Tax=Planococcus sp. YIM B11945 TaxID=3435410 RepID=UPI003D7C5723
MNEKDLVEMIKQMSEKDSLENEGEKGYINDDTLSWNAHRKAEQLSDPNVIPFLDDLLEKSKNGEIRRKIYYILGKIGKNTGNKYAVNVLLKWLEKE